MNDGLTNINVIQNVKYDIQDEIISGSIIDLMRIRQNAHLYQFSSNEINVMMEYNYMYVVIIYVTYILVLLLFLHSLVRVINCILQLCTTSTNKVKLN